MCVCLLSNSFDMLSKLFRNCNVDSAHVVGDSYQGPPGQTAEKVVLVFRVTQFAFFTLFCSVVKYYELIVVLVFGGS